MNNQANKKHSFKSNPFQFQTLQTQQAQIHLKKNTLDTSLNIVLPKNSGRSQSRNYQLPSGSNSQALPHSVAQIDNQFLKLSNIDGSFQLHQKARQSNSLSKYSGGQNRNQNNITNESFQNEPRGEKYDSQSPKNNQHQLIQESQLSNKKLSPYGQINNQITNATTVLQSSGLVKDLRREIQTQQILPPMIYNKQQSYSRNYAQKQSLSESIQNKMRGQSPKNLINSSQLKKSIEQDHEENSKKEARAGSMLGKGATGKQLPIKSRNSNMNLGEGPFKPQFHSVRGPGRQIQNINQSPQNQGGISRTMKQQLSPYNSQPQHQQVNSNNVLEAQFELDPLMILEQSYENAKFASKRNGVVVSYAANTHQGIVRNYNEDRVSIILNIIKPKFKEAQFWPRCSFFGVYDGHGGATCADYLRDQLHQLIVKDSNFPENPKQAIENAFAEAEKTFLDYAEFEAPKETGQIDRSGSCAIVVLIVGDMCYIANVGDSRAIMSAEGGEKILLLSKDHKPESDDEQMRIESNGGRIYQNSNYIPDMTPGNEGQMQLIVGPHRVFPGRLSVSRTFGDIEAKNPKFGGNPKVVVPTPDIKSFKIRNNYDFIVMGCDGIFEKLNNQEVINGVWSNSKLPAYLQKQDFRSIHEKCGTSVDRVMKDSVIKKTFDNITTVMIAFENFENVVGDVHHGVQEIKDNFNQFQRLEAVEEELIENEDVDTPAMNQGSTKYIMAQSEDPQKKLNQTCDESNRGILRASQKYLAEMILDKGHLDTTIQPDENRPGSHVSQRKKSAGNVRGSKSIIQTRVSGSNSFRRQSASPNTKQITQSNQNEQISDQHLSNSKIKSPSQLTRSSINNYQTKKKSVIMKRSEELSEILAQNNIEQRNLLNHSVQYNRSTKNKRSGSRGGASRNQRLQDLSYFQSNKAPLNQSLPFTTLSPNGSKEQARNKLFKSIAQNPLTENQNELANKQWYSNTGNVTGISKIASNAIEGFRKSHNNKFNK